MYNLHIWQSGFIINKKSNLVMVWLFGVEWLWVAVYSSKAYTACTSRRLSRLYAVDNLRVIFDLRRRRTFFRFYGGFGFWRLRVSNKYGATTSWWTQYPTIYIIWWRTNGQIPASLWTVFSTVPMIDHCAFHIFERTALYARRHVATVKSHSNKTEVSWFSRCTHYTLFIRVFCRRPSVFLF